MFSIAYIFLALAICVALFPHSSNPKSFARVWTAALLVIACVFAMSNGIVTAKGILQTSACALLLGAATLSMFSPSVDSFIRRWSGYAFLMFGLLVAFAMGVHFPRDAFNNEVVVSTLRITPDATPFTQYLNFDKGIAGALLLLFVVRTAPNFEHFVRSLKFASLVSVATLLLFVPLVLLFDHARFAPKWPEFALTFLFANLFFTVIAEECFFRGVIQEYAHRFIDKRGFDVLWHYAAIAVLSLPFAVVHITTSWVSFALVVLAGCSYGFVYFRTRSIESAVFVHFIVNAFHFFLFTYPQVAK
jgi:uncharacterized protein